LAVATSILVCSRRADDVDPERRPVGGALQLLVTVTPRVVV
jgi:hypothetical protein